MQRLIIQDRALRIAASTASVKGEDHHVGGSCRARLAGRQRTADRQEAGVNDPSAQRPGALPLPTGPPCDRGAKKEADDYIRQAAGRSPAQEIADAKALLEAGTITKAEFESLKAKSLS